MSKKDAKYLLNSYLQGYASKEEKALVESWYLGYMRKTIDSEIDELEVEINRQKILDYLMTEIERERKMNYRWNIGIAATVLMVLFAGILLLKGNRHRQEQHSLAFKMRTHYWGPGSNKAILIFSSGTSINLSHIDNGKLGDEKGIIIYKVKDSQIIYNQSKGVLTSEFNTMITPRGGQYQLVLSDGTKIWLNSSSYLKYPVAFTGKVREIELSGEAYFEVTHDPHKPFRVKSNGQTVEVLGTHFNINSYRDEPATKTTLLEGSVKVLAKNRQISKIRPGEQTLMRNGKLTVSEGGDLEQAIAWKKGLFYFKDNDIKEVMRQFSRWYDIEVKYEGQIPQRKFSGQLNKNIDASQLLHVLSIEKINYRIENRTIIITP